MIKIGNLRAPRGAKKKSKRVGRGPGSGHGKTSTRGHKGLKARSGGNVKAGFEGGQMPLHRRVPKKGFTNIFRKEYTIVNLDTLNTFSENTIVNPEFLVNERIIKKKSADLVKILGKGGLDKPLTIYAHKFSKSAISKINTAGGKVEVIQA